MTDSILIGSESEGLGNIVPCGTIPQRATFSSVLLFPIHTGEGRSIVVYDYDPQNWKLWFPLFSNVEWDLDIAGGAVKYSDLISKVELQALYDDVSPVGVLDLTLKDIEDKTGIRGLQCINEVFRPREFWLKYSKTRKIWSFYSFDYWVVDKCDTDIYKYSEMTGAIEIMPIEGGKFESIKKTGKFKGKGIADNLLSILRDESETDRLLTMSS